MNKIKEALSKYSKEYIEDLYINRNLNKCELANELGVSNHIVSNLLKEYNIHKSSDLIGKKREQTCLDKYGVYNPSLNDAVINKIKDTNIKRYGKASYVATKEGIEKAQKTRLERYGDKNYNNIEKGKLTKKIRYDNENYNNRLKFKETCMDKYGVENTFQLKRVIDKNKIDLFERMGYPQEFQEIFNDRDKAIEFLSDKNYSYYDLVKCFNCTYCTIQQWVSRLNLNEYINYIFNGKSHYEDEIVEYLKSLGVTNIIQNIKILHNKQEIDIYLKDYDIGIEFNGMHWHNDSFKTQNYHQDKSIEARQLGIRLIHIWDYEWDNDEQRTKIKYMLKSALKLSANRVYARDCEVRQIPDKDAKEFNELNHLQGHRGARLTYGLFYNDELVQLMSFSHNRKYEWEIIRSCTKNDTYVMGGLNKLFTHFLRENNPKEVFSYCDFNKFSGSSYLSLGMSEIGITKPDLKYIVNDKVVNRQPNKYKEIKPLVDACIYGSGSLKFLYTQNNC